MNRTAKWVVVALVSLVALNLAVSVLREPEGRRTTLSGALIALESRQVRSAELTGNVVVLAMADGRKLRARFPNTYVDDLIVQLHQRRIPFDVTSGAPGVLAVFVLLPFVLFAFFWRWLAGRLPPPTAA